MNELNPTAENQAQAESKPLDELIDQIAADIRSGESSALSEHVEDLKGEEIAELLEALPPRLRDAVWDEVPEALNGEVLPHLSDNLRAEMLDEMDEGALAAAAGQMSEGELADILEDLPEAQMDELMRSLDEDHRARVERVMGFPEGSAGRLMTSNVISVRQDVSLAVVLRWLRRHRELPPHTDALMVIDETGRYLGRLAMEDIVTGDPDDQVADKMHPGADVVLATTEGSEVARLFERRDLVTVAVVDEGGMLIGRITSDEIMDLMRAEADEQVLKPQGLREADELFAPVLPSVLRRGIWLGINLLTVLLAAWVIGRFEQALEQIVALAILMPVVASMGGIAGSQTLTLTLLGMTMDRIAPSNILWLMRKEITVGLINGLLWALVVGVVAFWWFGDAGIGAVIAAAMVLNLVAAAASGVLVPLALRRLGADPALSGAVVLTTVTDVVGFLAFLGLASLFLL
jgi:magnesium transporter